MTLLNWFKPKRDAKKEVTILDRMRKALVDEQESDRRIVRWRVSYPVLVAWVKALNRSVPLELRTFPAIDDPAYQLIMGIPFEVFTDWHGETFEYDAIDIPKPIPAEHPPGFITLIR